MIPSSNNNVSFYNVNSTLFISCLLLLITLNSCTKKAAKNPPRDFNTIYNSNISDSISKLLQPLVDQSFKTNDSGMIAVAVLLKENNTTLIDSPYFF